MPVDEQSLAAFERLVRFFRNLCMAGIAVIVLGLGALGFANGPALAASLGGTCTFGAVMILVGLRGLYKGNKMVARMRNELGESQL